MPKSKKESVNKKKSVKTNKPGNIITPVKPIEVKKGMKDSTIAAIIISVIIVIILVLMGLIILLFYLSVPEISRSLTVNDDAIGEALVEGNAAHVRLDDSLNLNDIKTIDIIFYDEEGNQYLYSASSVNQEYEILAEDLGLDSFDDIVSVSTFMDYEEENEEQDSPSVPTDSDTENPPIYIPSPGGGDSGGDDGDGDDGDGDDGGCTDECNAEGLFCENNTVYNCTKISGGCLELNKLKDCLKGEECEQGMCIPGPCESDANCSSDGCYYGEYRIYSCKDSYCSYNITTEVENISNGNCYDGIDNDCNGLIDGNDSGCSGQALCGNNVTELGEVCDGKGLNKTCLDFGYTNGNISCCSDCENFDLSSCYNITYGTCFDMDNGKNYYVFSNVSQDILFNHGKVCPNETEITDIGRTNLTLDNCNNNILYEGICNSTTGRPQLVEYDCSSEGRDCIAGRCVYPDLCGDEECEGGEERKLEFGANMTADYNYVGRVYSVELITTVSSTEALISVNGLLRDVTEGNSYLIDGLPFYVVNIVHELHINDSTRLITLFLGEDYRTCDEDCEVGCDDTCESLGWECGNRIICGNLTNCGTCDTGETCFYGACVEAGCGDGQCEGGSELQISISNVTDYYNYTGKLYFIWLIGITSPTSAKISINDISEEVVEGNSYMIDDLPLYVVDVQHQEYANETGSVTLFLGEDNRTCPADCGSGGGGGGGGGGGDACAPDCTGKECGDDGCGGLCGTCMPNEECTDGHCVTGLSSLSLFQRIIRWIFDIF